MYLFSGLWSPKKAVVVQQILDLARKSGLGPCCIRLFSDAVVSVDLDQGLIWIEVSNDRKIQVVSNNVIIALLISQFEIFKRVELCRCNQEADYYADVSRKHNIMPMLSRNRTCI